MRKPLWLPWWAPEDRVEWLLAVGLALIVALGALRFWLAYERDREECEQTGMHDACQDYVNISGGLYCLRTAKEPCEGSK